MNYDYPMLNLVYDADRDAPFDRGTRVDDRMSSETRRDTPVVTGPGVIGDGAPLAVDRAASAR
ncbi:MAG: hypothetical protein V3U63_11990, partial [Gemmatimonadota bacterium]